MEEIIHAFGIDWRLIAIQIFNFVLLAVLLTYFLYTPVLKMLREREEKIKKGVLDAEEAEKSRAEADVTKTAIIKEAHTEATAIVGRATVHAEEKGKEMLHDTEERIARELADAKARAGEMKAQALKDSEAEIAKLAILGAEQVLRKEITK
jgi:F-type H+-transporting ATPase subunit b